MNVCLADGASFGVLQANYGQLRKSCSGRISVRAAADERRQGWCTQAPHNGKRIMKETELLVEGMSCGSCVNHVDRALRSLSGVSKVEVRLREGKALVEHDPNAIDASALIASIQAAGYTAQLVT